MDNNTLIASTTLDWVQSFVIKHNLCPFAKAPVNKGALRIIVCDQTKKASVLEELMAEIHFLEEHAKIETTLLVFSQGFKDFFAYLDLLELAEDLLQQLEYDGLFQIASFHPDYYFADSNPDDVTNYTNRSPYPMLHILREESLEKAIAAYGSTEQIPEKNCQTLRELGLENIRNAYASYRNKEV